jgi:O-acetyl-ADP-ribose deacetylase (regulator of RNase III)
MAGNVLHPTLHTSVRYYMPKIELVEGDITKEKTDAIVNAANVTLLGGGGVDGAIHRAAGIELMRECRKIRRDLLQNGLPTGHAVATGAYKLLCKWVIHTVGPVYETSPNPERQLRESHQNCLKIADEIGARSVSFPAISAGAFGYPLLEAAPIALLAIRKAQTNVQLVRFVLFNEATLDVFQEAWRALER